MAFNIYAYLMKKLFIKTHGCQMNFYDSERMSDLLKPHGYQLENNDEDADFIILNTCHIREKAVEKTYNVNVTSVNTINVLGKSISKFTKTGVVTGRKPSYKKAIVQLKDGEFIDFYSQI